jgi:hypothetical protein
MGADDKLCVFVAFSDLSPDQVVKVVEVMTRAVTGLALDSVPSTIRVSETDELGNIK